MTRAENLTRYAYYQGQPDYDNSTTHAAGRNGRTLCGTKVGKSTDRGGNWERGGNWDVSCQRCRRKMEGA